MDSVDLERIADNVTAEAVATAITTIIATGTAVLAGLSFVNA